MTRPGRKHSAETRAKISAAVSRPDVQGRRITTLRDEPTSARRARAGSRTRRMSHLAVGRARHGLSVPGAAAVHLPLRMRAVPHVTWQLHHQCGVRLCVNPDHQVPLTTMQHGACTRSSAVRTGWTCPCPSASSSRAASSRESWPGSREARSRSAGRGAHRAAKPLCEAAVVRRRDGGPTDRMLAGRVRHRRGRRTATRTS